MTNSNNSKPYIEKLAAHNVADFNCGWQELDRFLQKFAFANQQANNSQTYVAVNEGAIIGYYSLV